MKQPYLMVQKEAKLLLDCDKYRIMLQLEQDSWSEICAGSFFVARAWQRRKGYSIIRTSGGLEFPFFLFHHAHLSLLDFHIMCSNY